ncbi:MAG: hypothetical protein KBS96_01240 [Lachnospiraceae bacterium]|nr:hypothetical protein [Candidatus Colinaster scatohippi]
MMYTISEQYFLNIASSEINMGGSSCIHKGLNGDIVGKSEKQAFDKWYHYDNSGNKLGYSIVGTAHWYHYDNSGNEIGHSNEGFLGRFDHYDNSSNCLGYSILQYGYKWSHSLK